MRDITVGADPEMFIVNTKTNKVVSAIGLIPGEKGNPYTEGLPKGFGLEIDNILAEYNIPPITDMISFITSIDYMKNYIDSYVKSKNPDLGIQCIASRHVDDDQLTDPEARRFGCSPDFNVYTRKQNPKPKGENTNLRSAGAHLHFGIPQRNTKTIETLVRGLDFLLGIPSVIIDPDMERRRLYGKAGSFRMTPYGFEYRVLSSYMFSNSDILRIIWEGIEKLFEVGYYDEYNPSTIRNIIDNSDVDSATEIIMTSGLFGSDMGSRKRYLDQLIKLSKKCVELEE